MSHDRVDSIAQATVAMPSSPAHSGAMASSGPGNDQRLFSASPSPDSIRAVRSPYSHHHPEFDSGNSSTRNRVRASASATSFKAAFRQGMKFQSRRPDLHSQSSRSTTNEVPETTSRDAYGDLISRSSSPNVSIHSFQRDHSWYSTKILITQGMREGNLLEEGSPVQWISSKNIAWTNGIGYISAQGALHLVGEEENIIISNLRLTKIVSNVKQRYVELIVNPPQGKCSRVIIVPTDESDFNRWTGALLLWSNLKPYGIEHKLHLPILPIEPSEEDLLVCHFHLYYLRPNSNLTPSSASNSNSNSTTNSTTNSTAASSVASSANVSMTNLISSSTSSSRINLAASNTTATINSSDSAHTNPADRPVRRARSQTGPARPTPMHRQTSSDAPAFNSDISWRPVVGVLSRSGVLEILSEADGAVIERIDMQKVLSSRVRYVSYSLFEKHRVIYLQPTEGILPPGSPEAGEAYMFLHFDRLADYEDWFSTLKCFSKKRIFCPTSRNLQKSIRISRRINIRILECKVDDDSSLGPSYVSPFYNSYVEIQFEGRVWCRTFVARNEQRPFWREDFVLQDFPVRCPDIKIVVKNRLSAKLNPRNDPVIGILMLDQIPTNSKDVETWYRIKLNKDLTGKGTKCSICLKIGYEEVNILDQSHYRELRQLLTTDLNANNLTTQIAEHLVETASHDLNKLADILLNIYQAEGLTVQWLASLIRTELTRVKENLCGCSDNAASSAETSYHIDNTLFRGNTIISKSLEKYMKLVGRAYLEKTVGAFTQKVLEADELLEIDPSRIDEAESEEEAQEIAKANQKKLMIYVRELWDSIRESTDDMPQSFKVIFKQLRLELSLHLCQEEHVVLNCVSGFLFLRFLCPALLNPKLAGLVRAHPSARGQRTLTLLAKILQTFANRVKFGFKEPWMIPMNDFIDLHEQELDVFYREITLAGTGGSADEDSVFTSGSASRPPKEQPVPSVMGECLSNPFLIDKYEAYAKLVDLWASRPVKTTSSVSLSDVNEAVISDDESVEVNEPTTTADSQIFSRESSSSDVRDASTIVMVPRNSSLFQTCKLRTKTEAATQERAMHKFDTICYNLHRKQVDLYNHLVDAETINQDDLDDYVANTHMTYNVETGHVTLRKYAVAVAKAAAEQASNGMLPGLSRLSISSSPGSSSPHSAQTLPFLKGDQLNAKSSNTVVEREVSTAKTKSPSSSHKAAQSRKSSRWKVFRKK
uniref:ARAD1D22506p n=1 Tax=Blastobotrys adeninivorans TaxID=409370 RepID=A0A060T9X2_BLAAD